ncbi:MAG: hypothetical protein HY736_23930 [Verrucomicrobia bacterium]|nr:hypothetical protein [Verrucomicrobiota bacterium]
MQEAAIRSRNATTFDRDPQYANDRFKDDFNGPTQRGGQWTKSIGSVLHLGRWINPSFNFAETFNRPAPQPRIDSSLFPPTVATGYDYAWRMELFERRLNLNFIHYRTKEINADTGGDGPGFFNELFDANIVENKRPVQDQPIINFYADYTIQDGWLRRLRIGGGVRYRGRQIAGFRGSDTIVNPANPAQAIDDPRVDEYTPVYTPDDFYLVTGTLGYSWRLKDRREIRANLVINNLLNDRGPIFGQATAVRPRHGDYTSPARETIPNGYGLKQPISYSLTMSLKL